MSDLFAVRAGAARLPQPGQPVRYAALPGLLLVVGLAGAIGGCATDGGIDWRQPFAGGLPWHGPNEADFLALVREHCAGQTIGGETLGRRLDSDPVFQQQTNALFAGDLSNDEYLNAVLVVHPAADANVPAVGCVVTQLQRCLGGRCDVPPAPAVGSGAIVADVGPGSAATPPTSALDATPVEGGVAVSAVPLSTTTGVQPRPLPQDTPRPLP